MIKRLLLSGLAACMVFAASAQAILPTSWDFETAPSVPTGWSTNTSSFYGTGNSGIAGKLNGDSQFFQVEFLDEPGQLSYYMKGWVGGSVTSWVGTFTVQESDDGVSWTTLRQFVDNLDVNSYVQFTDQPASTTRYIRWFYTDKQSGANVGLDDVQIDLPIAGPAQEINCTFGGNNVPSSSQIAFNSPVSTTTPITITVENLGTVNTLNVTNATISGPAMADYSITNTPNSITAGNSSALTIDFTPSSAGTREATLTIDNDDANENPYIIELYGVGGDYATEPSAAPTALSFNNVKSFRMDVSYTGSNADGYLIVRRAGAAPTSAPTDGTEYLPGDMIGNAKVMYVGPSVSCAPKGVVAGVDYYFDVFAYNGFGQYVNYLESTPLSGNQTSAMPNPGTYYNGIDPLQSTFATDLGNLINSHSFIWYGEYDEVYIRYFGHRDTTNSQQVVDCAYSGEKYVYTSPFDWSYMSREHSYPHSWMPTNPADNPEQEEYNDFHHIFPVQFSDVNQVRTNLPLGNVVNVAGSYLDTKIGTDANGDEVFEVRDEFKGDVARALFYMATAYDVEGQFEDWSLPEWISIFVPYGQSEAVLKEWHYADPPSAWEMARNDFIDSVQGNRNPYIDNPDWVCYINFDSMTYNANPPIPCGVVSIAEQEGDLQGLEVFPNPSNGPINISFSAMNAEPVNLIIRDVTGKEVYRTSYKTVSGQNLLQVNADLAQGSYTIEISNGVTRQTRSVVMSR